MQIGLYEQLLNKLIVTKLATLDKKEFFIKENSVDKSEAAQILAQYLNDLIGYALSLITGEESVSKQIELSNKIILLIKNYLDVMEFENDLISVEGKILTAVFSKINPTFANFENHLKRITPYSRLSNSELFTGNNSGISLESEIKKEILSSDRISFLVSFIKWTGIRLFENELREFTNRGGSLKVITTSYMGATDLRAIEFLSSLENTEIKVSYNTDNERLHAKAYLFYRNTGFHTGYIGSSNLSRSALTNGLEWNIKVTTKEVSQIIDKFQKTFETYWEDKEFEYFDKNRDVEKLKTALRKERFIEQSTFSSFFDLKPYPFQQEILEELQTQRLVHNRYRNLLVAATGTGKTVISAFDFKKFRNEYPNAKLLFIAHRKEILLQAQSTFRGILKDQNFGELWVDGLNPEKYDCVFASVQTLNNNLSEISLKEDFYDFIIIDEVHHIAASSYRSVLNNFSPKILLGLTATPERMDGADILSDFCNVIAAEIRLPEALNRKLLCPFQYFGVTDNVDLSEVSWVNGRYLPSELSAIYTANDQRVNHIITNINKYLNNINDVRALCFCVTQEHARFMAEKFTLSGLKAAYLTSENSQDRITLRQQFQAKNINYLFVVDIFNEGVDIPEIDTILFLRPTESLTVFLQQLGRGLRFAEGKDILTVLDFVGNSRPEYDFEGKFRALVGKTISSMKKEIEDDFPHLPLGCSIVLQKVAKEAILKNIASATNLNRNQLINKIRNFQHQTLLQFNLKNFCDFHHLSLQQIYKRGSWKRMCQEAGLIENFEITNEREIIRAISKKWMSCNSYSYFRFIEKLAIENFKINFSELNDEEKQMCLMLHYDVWQDVNKFSSIEESIIAIGANKTLNIEVLEVLRILISKTNYIEYNVTFDFIQPLKVHSRYTREQILSGFGFSTFQQKSNIREGVAFSREKNIELLFITLTKSEENFSSTTLYEDFAISEILFHWQSQNNVSDQSTRGKSYINHRVNGRKILLFVREKSVDEFGNSMGSVFLGEASFKGYYGSKPMSITWELKEPIPPYLWKDIAKMAVG